MSEDLKVYKASELFLVELVHTTAGSKFLLGVAGIQSFKTILNSSRTRGTIKLRLYETLCKFSNFSANPLEQMNGLEILSILAETKHRVEHLEKTGVINKIQRHSVNWKEDSVMVNLLYPAALKFLEKVEITQAPIPLAEAFIDHVTKQLEPILHL